VQGIAPNNGFVIRALDESSTAPRGEAFFTPLSSSKNGGQGGFTTSKAPKLVIEWRNGEPVGNDYPIDETTINLRTITENHSSGKLQFRGVFALYYIKHSNAKGYHIGFEF